MCLSVVYKDENRIIYGDVLYYNDSIIFDTKMTRFNDDKVLDEYLVLDVFNPTYNGYELISRYSDDEIEYRKDINMKGRMK